jgi:hypothetical protein
MNDTGKPLDQVLDAGARLHDQPTPLRKILAGVDSRAAQGDLARWMASGARLLETARTRLLRAEHDFETGRAKIVADAQLQLTEFRQRTHEELRRFDSEHHDRIAELREDIERLEHMREAGEWPIHQ